MTNRHRNEYEARLHRVLAYIDTHLDEPIDLAQLAQVAAFSAFHFHRIFAAHTGETLGSYLTRRRVELAAARLASQPRLRVLDVALAVGFGSAEAFTRAFKKRFGHSPTEWKRRPLSRGGKKSNPSQVERSLDQAKRRRIGYASTMVPVSTSPLHVVVKTRPAVRIAYLRYQGPFGAAVGRFWQNEVYPWMVSQDLVGRPRYGISQDDPDITAKNQCRYDAGVEVGTEFVPAAKAQIAAVPGGLYACTAFKGTSAEIAPVFQRMLREWLPASGYQLDARPCFEHYPIDSCFDHKTGAFTCELCIPIARL